MSESSTLPLKVAETGPILVLTTAAKPLSPVLSSDWQPGMQALRTSGSLSSAQTFGRPAGSVASPVIVIAMDVPSCRGLFDRPPLRPQRRFGSAVGLPAAAYSQGLSTPSSAPKSISGEPSNVVSFGGSSGAEQMPRVNRYILVNRLLRLSPLSPAPDRRRAASDRRVRRSALPQAIAAARLRKLRSAVLNDRMRR